jgi:hypothetical protein
MANGKAGIDHKTNASTKNLKTDPGRYEVRRTFGFRCEAKARSRLRHREEESKSRVLVAHKSLL